MAAERTGSLSDVERKLEQARSERDRLKQASDALARDLRAIRREMVSAAAGVRGREAEMTRTEARLEEISRLERERLASLKLDEGELAHVLAALARMSRNPPGAMLLQPISPTNAVRAAILLRASVPAIEDRTGRLRRDLTELAHARIEAKGRREELAITAIRLEADRTRLEALFKKKAALKQTSDAEQKAAEAEARALALQAKNMKDLLSGLKKAGAERRRVRLVPPPRKFPQPAPQPLSQSPSQPPPQPPPQSASQPAPSKEVAALPPSSRAQSFAAARGLLPFPVVGQLTGRYGDKLESGLKRKGIVIAARPNAQVIAPFDGRVVFAGPFRGYGRLLIIEHGEGYHTLLAGVARIDVRAGQNVLAGEPVGIMDSPSDQKPGLYVELRKDSQPINPTPWLQTQKDEVSG